MSYKVKNVIIEDNDTNDIKIKKYRDAIKKYPDDCANYLVQLSIVYMMMGENKKCLQCAKDVEKLFKGRKDLSDDDKRQLSEANHVIADFLSEDGDLDTALEYLMNAYIDDPDFENMQRLAECYLERGEYDKAEEYYFKLLAEDLPWNVDTYVEGMTNVYKAMGKKKNVQKDIYDKVFAYYDAELSKNPDIPERHKILGDLVVAYYNLDKESKAEKLDAERDALVYTALKDYEKYAKFLSNAGNEYRNNGKTGLAALIDEQYLKRKENTMSKEISINYRLHIADGFKDGNEFQKAIEHYLTILEEVPNSEGALLGLGICYFILGKKEIAKPYLQRYAELYKASDPRVYSSLAICYMDDKEFELAIEFCLKAAELDNGKEEGFLAIMYGSIGTMYSKNLHDYPNAFKYYRMAMKAKPNEAVLGEMNLHILNMSFKPQGHDLATEFWKDYPQNKDAVIAPPSLTEEEIKQLPYHYSKIKQASEPDADDYYLKFEEDFIKEIESNPAAVEYLKAKYHPASITKFKRHYAEHKTKIIQGGEFYSDLNKNKDEMDLYYAKEAFELILQKKLFNKQILWRAKNLNLPGVEFSGDFDIWRERLDECPFLDEVTTEEVELLKRFMMEDNYSAEPKYWLHSWQDYEGFMEEDEDGEREYMPEWYNYYDSNLGTGALLSLPDVRGPKEKVYQQLGAMDQYKKAKEEHEQKVKDGTLPPPVKYVQPPSRFYWFHEENEINEFISKFDNDYIRQLQKGWMDNKASTIEDYPEETITEAIETLKKADQPITLRSDMVWWEAIYLAARNYKNQKIIEDLDDVFEEYQMRKSLPEGVNINIETNEALIESKKSLHQGMMNARNTKAEQILRGRELKGEPKDFSFLD